MDAEARRLGLRGSSWRNPHGLDARGHRSTAFDLAILARAVLHDRWLARVVRTRRAAFTTPSGRRHTLTARSRFLLGYRGALRVKTGLTGLLVRPPRMVQRHGAPTPRQGAALPPGPAANEPAADGAAPGGPAAA